MAGGPVTHPPATEAASGAVRAPGTPPQAKPSLQERLQALESKHGVAAALGRPPAHDLTEPRRSPDQDDVPATMDDAVANVREAFGDAITWEAQFDHHTDSEGRRIYVHRESGQVFDTLPALNQTDGKPEDSPRKG